MYNETCYQLGVRRNCIRELFEFGRQRAAVVGAENVFDYSLGNPSLPAPPEVNRAIHDILNQEESLAVHGYTSNIGDYEARAAVARDLNERFGADARPEEIFLTCGAAPALIAVLRALAVPEGEVLAIAPYFTEYKPFTECSGLRFRLVPPDIPDFQIRLDAVEAMLNPHTQALILNSPNNPSGVVYTRKTLTELASLLERKEKEYGHPIYIISDEPYRELAYGVEVPFIPGIYRDTVVCYSYSKCLSIPGERLGYVYVPRRAADGEQLYWTVTGGGRASGHICAPSIWQRVIVRCSGLKPDLASYDRARTLLYESLKDMGYRCAKPDGAFYIFVEAPGGDAAAFSQRAKKKDLLVVPGGDFGCASYFRLCYCIPYEKIQRSLPLFRELMDECRAEGLV